MSLFLGGHLSQRTDVLVYGVVGRGRDERADEILIAVDVVDATHRRPELALNAHRHLQAYHARDVTSLLVN